MPFSLVETWDGVTAPSLPADWNTTGLATSTSVSLSAPNSLALTSVAPGLFFSNNTNFDSAGGATIDAVTYLFFDSVGVSDTIEGGLTFRCTSATMSSPGASSYWASLAFDQTGGGVLRFSSISSGSPTAIHSLTCGAGEIAQSTWYAIRVVSSGVDTFDVVLARYSDGHSLNSSGVFQSGSTVAFTVNPTTVPFGGYYGLSAQISNGANRVFMDGFGVNASPPAVVAYPRRPVIARVPFQYYVTD